MHCVSAEDILRVGMGMLGVMRRARSPQWCRRRLVGPMRELVKEPFAPHQVQSIRPGAEETRAMIAAELKRHCEHCGECKLGRLAEIMPPPH